MVKQLCILGSTGSIGTQTLDVVRAYPDRYQVYAICANTSVDKLVEQAKEFKPEVVCIADESLYESLNAQLSPLNIKVWAGAEAIAEVVTMPSIDIVVAAMVGYAGLKPTIEAIKAGKTIALANKETLVVAGEIICELAQQYHTPILPVDSEHSAIFQSLVGEDRSEIEKILLTASGGPFRTFSLEQMKTVTAADALKHPNWEMGAKITIDSASMMNKGFEVIEAKWLFGVPVEKIQVLVHPQSIVHSAVQFTDGAIKAQLGAPDMRLPIQYALSFPERLASDFPRADLFALKDLSFEEPDLNRFPNLGLAYEAMRRGGNIPCVLNAANEVVNLAFRQGRCGFLTMSEVIANTMDKSPLIQKPTYENYVETDKEARRIAEEELNHKS
jgi:1-deoxy-D-xylulose-5-phosphate reductoisomerase